MTTATIETNIWQALKAQIETLSSPVNFDLAWPLDTFVPPKDTNGLPKPYIEVLDMPNQVARILIGSSAPQDRKGILGLHLMYPVASGIAFEVQKQLASLIAAHFPTDFVMTYGGVSVRVSRAADIMQPIRDDAYIRWPISIRWQAYA